MASIVGIVLAVLLAVIVRATSRQSAYPSAASRFGALDKLIVGWTLLCGIVLTITGFWPIFFDNEQIHGYLLIWHVIVGGGFAAGLTALAIFRAHAYRFEPMPQHTGTSLQSNSESGNQNSFETGKKLLFWCFLTLGFLATVTILLSMIPLFGTTGLHLMYEMHRWSSLLLVMAGIALLISK